MPIQKFFMKSILSFGRGVNARPLLVSNSKISAQRFANNSSNVAKSRSRWPADTKLEPVTFKNHLIKFEPINQADIPSLVPLITETFVPNEPTFRSTGAAAAYEAAKKNPNSPESVEFWKQSRALIYSLFIYPGLASRPNLSFKVLASNNSTGAATREEQLIGVLLCHMEYIGPEGSCNSYLYAKHVT